MINDNIMDISKNLTKAEIRQEEIIKLVLRQTDYDRENVLKKLEKWDNNYLYVIKEYMNPNFNPSKKQEKKFSSNNQQVFGEIRSFMDNANKQYYKRKKQEEKNKQIQQALYLRYLKQQKEKAAKKAKTNLEPICENKIIEDAEVIKI